MTGEIIIENSAGTYCTLYALPVLEITYLELDGIVGSTVYYLLLLGTVVTTSVSSSFDAIDDQNGSHDGVYSEVTAAVME